MLAVYDKSVEYISGGSNVQEIKEFFWKWRRSHTPASETSLERRFGNLCIPALNGCRTWASLAKALSKRPPIEWRCSESDPHMLFRGGGTRMYSRAKSMALADGIPAPAAAAGPAGAAPGAELSGLAPNRANATTSEAAPPLDLVQPTVRTKFADTALWVASLTTDENGLAEVSLDMPENLTTWKVKVWGMGHGTKVGQGEAEVITRKGPDRAPAGAAVLRREGRSGAVAPTSTTT